jgi:hypothetical protein
MEEELKIRVINEIGIDFQEFLNVIFLIVVALSELEAWEAPIPPLGLNRIFLIDKQLKFMSEAFLGLSTPFVSDNLI